MRTLVSLSLSLMLVAGSCLSTALPAFADSEGAAKLSDRPAVDHPVQSIAQSAANKAQVVDKLKAVDANRPIRDKWALVVGIGKFQNPKVHGLTFAAKDARDFYDFLIKEANFAPDHVRLLLDEKATERRVMSELGNKFLARVVKPDDLVVLFFSTHGSPAELDVRGENYVVAYDSDPDDLYATGIEMTKITERINERVLTDRVLLVLDACHSGSTTAKDAKGIFRKGNFDADVLALGSGQLIMCSSQPEEESWESTRYQNGVFTRRLLDGLRAEGPRTKLAQAFKSAERSVADEVREDRPGARQTPVLKGKWDGNELIIAAKPAAPQQIPVKVKEELEPDSSLVTVTVVDQPRTTPAGNPVVESVPAVDAAEAFASKSIDELDVNIYNKWKVLHLNARSLGIPKTREEANEELRSINAKVSLSSTNHATDLFMQSRCFIAQGKLERALATMLNAADLERNGWKHYLLLAYIHHKLGSRIPAMRALEEARFHNPELPRNIDFQD